jgi:pantoate kinase
MVQPPESGARFDAFRKIVLACPALLEQLRAAPDVTAFVELVRETAGKYGFDFTIEEVHAALRASQQAWIERWM